METDFEEEIKCFGVKRYWIRVVFIACEGEKTSCHSRSAFLMDVVATNVNRLHCLEEVYR